MGRRQSSGAVLVARGTLLLLLLLVQLDRCRFELADQRLVVGRNAGPQKLSNGGEALLVSDAGFSQCRCRRGFGFLLFLSGRDGCRGRGLRTIDRGKQRRDLRV